MRGIGHALRRRNVDVKAGDEQQVLASIVLPAEETAIGAIEFDLRMIARGVEGWMGGRHQGRHCRAERSFQEIVPFRPLDWRSAEEEHVGRKPIADRRAALPPDVGR